MYLDERRNRGRGRKKTFHGSYGTIDPARTVFGRSAWYPGSGKKLPGGRPQYIAQRAHLMRGGRGASRPMSPGLRIAILTLILIAVIALAAFLLNRTSLLRPSSATRNAVVRLEQPARILL